MRGLSEQLLRLQRIEPFLRCPQCGGKLIRQGNEAYKSESCGAQYAIDHGVPILLPPSLVAQGLGKPLPPDQHASTHPYSPSSDALIAQFEAGLLLDLGAGGKHIERVNVVQVDVFRFPMVDVVASADALPFRADTFDAVISQAVFEHLQYPEAAAAEIWRILKPDGVAKIDTAFLQPEHAYPHHYFNATEAGLRHWFRDFELQWSGVEDYQHPKWALLWFLDVYLAALPPAAQEKVWPIDLANCVAVLKRLQTGQVDTDADLEISLALDELAPESVRALAAGVSVKAVKRTAMSGISRQKGVFNSGVQLELERRLQAQAERAKEGGEYQRAIAELKTIADDRTRFLAHEYELNRQDPLVNPGLVRPLIRLLVREIRHRLPASWEFALRRHYRQWIQTKPQRADVSEMMPRAALTFWSCPKTPVGLLDQFFSLVRQTHGDWVYLLQTSSDHSPAMKRLMWELERRDRRVYILSEQNVKTDLLGVASVHLPSDAVLTFDAVHELCTLLQHHPHASCITADLEKWFHIDQYPIRCWGQEYLHISPTEVGLRLLNSRPIKATAVATSIPLKTYAHIPKVLYRLMPFAQA